MADTYEPPYVEWNQILKKNLATRSARDEALGRERVSSIRDRVVALAAQHTKRIVEAATRCGIANATFDNMQNASAARIVMAGHQPVVYHPGLLCKVQALSKFARDVDAIAVQVVIDTDEGDSGALVWPRLSHEGFEIRRGSLVDDSAGSSLYLGQRVASAEHVARIFAEIEADLVQSGLSEGAAQARYVGSFYQQLSGELVSVAHAVVRWALDDSRALEVPLSIIVQDREVQAVLDCFAGDGARLTAVYNASLDSYRRDHRIHNPANPFPNMRVSDGEIELPLWQICAGARSALYVRNPEVDRRAQGSFLAPRGSITTLLLRGFCSDFFIHGLGGGKYDRFVDRFARAYLSVDLPSYVVASRTWYLFPEKVAELRRSLELASKVKEIASKTESFLGQGIFSKEEEIELYRLSAERKVMREALQQASTPEERSAVSHRLNAANREVRALIENGSLRDHVAHAAAREVSLARWSFREFPFFLYKLPRSA